LQHGRGSHDHTGADVVQVLGGLEVSDVLEHEGIGGLYSTARVSAGCLTTLFALLALQTECCKPHDQQHWQI